MKDRPILAPSAVQFKQITTLTSASSTSGIGGFLNIVSSTTITMDSGASFQFTDESTSYTIAVGIDPIAPTSNSLALSDAIFQIANTAVTSGAKSFFLVASTESAAATLSLSSITFTSIVPNGTDPTTHLPCTLSAPLITATTGVLTLSTCQFSLINLYSSPLLAIGPQPSQFTISSSSTFSYITRLSGNGAVFATITNSPSNSITISNAVFTKCSAAGGSGGVLAITLTTGNILTSLDFKTSIQFDSCFASAGGNCVYIESEDLISTSFATCLIGHVKEYIEAPGDYIISQAGMVMNWYELAPVVMIDGETPDAGCQSYCASLQGALGVSGANRAKITVATLPLTIKDSLSFARPFTLTGVVSGGKPTLIVAQVASPTKLIETTEDVSIISVTFCLTSFALTSAATEANSAATAAGAATDKLPYVAASITLPLFTITSHSLSLSNIDFIWQSPVDSDYYVDSPLSASLITLTASSKLLLNTVTFVSIQFGTSSASSLIDASASSASLSLSSCSFSDITVYDAPLLKVNAGHFSMAATGDPCTFTNIKASGTTTGQNGAVLSITGLGASAELHLQNARFTNCVSDGTDCTGAVYLQFTSAPNEGEFLLDGVVFTGPSTLLNYVTIDTTLTSNDLQQFFVALIPSIAPFINDLPALDGYYVVKAGPKQWYEFLFPVQLNEALSGCSTSCQDSVCTVTCDTLTHAVAAASTSNLHAATIETNTMAAPASQTVFTNNFFFSGTYKAAGGVSSRVNDDPPVGPVLPIAAVSGDSVFKLSGQNSMVVLFKTFAITIVSPKKAPLTIPVFLTSSAADCLSLNTITFTADTTGSADSAYEPLTSPIISAPSGTVLLTSVQFTAITVGTGTSLISTPTSKLTMSGCSFNSITLANQPLLDVSLKENYLSLLPNPNDAAVNNFEDITRKEGSTDSSGGSVFEIVFSSNSDVFSLHHASFKNCKVEGGSAFYGLIIYIDASAASGIVDAGDLTFDGSDSAANPFVYVKCSTTYANAYGRQLISIIPVTSGAIDDANSVYVYSEGTAAYSDIQHLPQIVYLTKAITANTEGCTQLRPCTTLKASFDVELLGDGVRTIILDENDHILTETQEIATSTVIKGMGDRSILNVTLESDSVSSPAAVFSITNTDAPSTTLQSMVFLFLSAEPQDATSNLPDYSITWSLLASASSEGLTLDSVQFLWQASLYPQYYKDVAVSTTLISVTDGPLKLTSVSFTNIPLASESLITLGASNTVLFTPAGTSSVPACVFTNVSLTDKGASVPTVLSLPLTDASFAFTNLKFEGCTNAAGKGIVAFSVDTSVTLNSASLSISNVQFFTDASGTKQEWKKGSETSPAIMITVEEEDKITNLISNPLNLPTMIPDCVSYAYKYVIVLKTTGSEPTTTLFALKHLLDSPTTDDIVYVAPGTQQEPPNCGWEDRPCTVYRTAVDPSYAGAHLLEGSHTELARRLTFTHDFVMEGDAPSSTGMPSQVTVIQGLKYVCASAATLTFRQLEFTGTTPDDGSDSGDNTGGGGGSGGARAVANEDATPVTLQDNLIATSGEACLVLENVVFDTIDISVAKSLISASLTQNGLRMKNAKFTKITRSDTLSSATPAGSVFMISTSSSSDYINLGGASFDGCGPATDPDHFLGGAISIIANPTPSANHVSFKDSTFTTPGKAAKGKYIFILCTDPTTDFMTTHARSMALDFSTSQDSNFIYATSLQQADMKDIYSFYDADTLRVVSSGGDGSSACGGFTSPCSSLNKALVSDKIKGNVGTVSILTGTHSETAASQITRSVAIIGTIDSSTSDCSSITFTTISNAPALITLSVGESASAFQVTVSDLKFEFSAASATGLFKLGTADSSKVPTLALQNVIISAGTSTPNFNISKEIIDASVGVVTMAGVVFQYIEMDTSKPLIDCTRGSLTMAKGVSFSGIKLTSASLITATKGSVSMTATQFDTITLSGAPLLEISTEAGGLTMNSLTETNDDGTTTTTLNEFKTVKRSTGNGAIFSATLTSTSALVINNAKFCDCTSIIGLMSFALATDVAATALTLGSNLKFTVTDSSKETEETWATDTDKTKSVAVFSGSAAVFSGYAYLRSLLPTDPKQLWTSNLYKYYAILNTFTLPLPYFYNNFLTQKPLDTTTAFAVRVSTDGSTDVPGCGWYDETTSGIKLPCSTLAGAQNSIGAAVGRTISLSTETLLAEAIISHIAVPMSIEGKDSTTPATFTVSATTQTINGAYITTSAPSVAFKHIEVTIASIILTEAGQKAKQAATDPTSADGKLADAPVIHSIFSHQSGELTLADVKFTWDTNSDTTNYQDSPLPSSVLVAAGGSVSLAAVEFTGIKLGAVPLITLAQTATFTIISKTVNADGTETTCPVTKFDTITRVSGRAAILDHTLGTGQLLTLQNAEFKKSTVQKNGQATDIFLAVPDLASTITGTKQNAYTGSTGQTLPFVMIYATEDIAKYKGREFKFLLPATLPTDESHPFLYGTGTENLNDIATLKDLFILGDGGSATDAGKCDAAAPCATLQKATSLAAQLQGSVVTIPAATTIAAANVAATIKAATTIIGLDAESSVLSITAVASPPPTDGFIELSTTTTSPSTSADVTLSALSFHIASTDSAKVPKVVIDTEATTECTLSQVSFVWVSGDSPLAKSVIVAKGKMTLVSCSFTDIKMNNAPLLEVPLSSDFTLTPSLDSDEIYHPPCLFTSITRAVGNGAIIQGSLGSSKLTLQNAVFTGCGCLAGAGVMFFSVQSAAATALEVDSSVQYLKADGSAMDWTSSSILNCAFMFYADQSTKFTSTINLKTLFVSDLAKTPNKYYAQVKAKPAVPLLHYVSSPHEAVLSASDAIIHTSLTTGIDETTCGWTDLKCKTLSAALTSADREGNVQPQILLEDNISDESQSAALTAKRGFSITTAAGKTITLMKSLSSVHATIDSSSLTNSPATVKVFSLSINFKASSTFSKSIIEIKSSSDTLAMTDVTVTCLDQTKPASLTESLINSLGTLQLFESTFSYLTASASLISAASGSLTLQAVSFHDITISGAAPLLAVNPTSGKLTMNPGSDQTMNKFTNIDRKQTGSGDIGGSVFCLEVSGSSQEVVLQNALFTDCIMSPSGNYLGGAIYVNLKDTDAKLLPNTLSFSITGSTHSSNAEPKGLFVYAVIPDPTSGTTYDASFLLGFLPSSIPEANYFVYTQGSADPAEISNLLSLDPKAHVRAGGSERACSAAQPCGRLDFAIAAKKDESTIVIQIDASQSGGSVADTNARCTIQTETELIGQNTDTSKISLSSTIALGQLIKVEGVALTVTKLTISIDSAAAAVTSSVFKLSTTTSTSGGSTNTPSLSLKEVKFVGGSGVQQAVKACVVDAAEGELTLEGVSFTNIKTEQDLLSIGVASGSLTMKAENSFTNIERTEGSGAVFEVTLKADSTFKLENAAFTECISTHQTNGVYDALAGAVFITLEATTASSSLSIASTATFIRSPSSALFDSCHVSGVTFASKTLPTTPANDWAYGVLLSADSSIIASGILDHFATAPTNTFYVSDSGYQKTDIQTCGHKDLPCSTINEILEAAIAAGVTAAASSPNPTFATLSLLYQSAPYSSLNHFAEDGNDVTSTSTFALVLEGVQDTTTKKYPTLSVSYGTAGTLMRIKDATSTKASLTVQNLNIYLNTLVSIDKSVFSLKEAGNGASLTLKSLAFTKSSDTSTINAPIVDAESGTVTLTSVSFTGLNMKGCSLINAVKPATDNDPATSATITITASSFTSIALVGKPLLTVSSFTFPTQPADTITFTSITRNGGSGAVFELELGSTGKFALQFVSFVECVCVGDDAVAGAIYLHLKAGTYELSLDPSSVSFTRSGDAQFDSASTSALTLTASDASFYGTFAKNTLAAAAISKFDPECTAENERRYFVAVESDKGSFTTTLADALAEHVSEEGTTSLIVAGAGIDVNGCGSEDLPCLTIGKAAELLFSSSATSEDTPIVNIIAQTTLDSSSIIANIKRDLVITGAGQTSVIRVAGGTGITGYLQVSPTEAELSGETVDVNPSLTVSSLAFVITSSKLVSSPTTSPTPAPVEQSVISSTSTGKVSLSSVSFDWESVDADDLEDSPLSASVIDVSKGLLELAGVSFTRIKMGKKSLLSAASLSLSSNCAFTLITKTQGDGTIASLKLSTAAQSVSISSSTFIGCSLESGNGGVFAITATSAASPESITIGGGLTFIACTAPGGNGGSLYIKTAVTPVFADISFVSTYITSALTLTASARSGIYLYYERDSPYAGDPDWTQVRSLFTTTPAGDYQNTYFNLVNATNGVMFESAILEVTAEASTNDATTCTPQILFCSSIGSAWAAALATTNIAKYDKRTIFVNDELSDAKDVASISYSVSIVSVSAGALKMSNKEKTSSYLSVGSGNNVLLFVDSLSISIDAATKETKIQRSLFTIADGTNNEISLKDVTITTAGASNAQCFTSASVIDARAGTLTLQGVTFSYISTTTAEPVVTKTETEADTKEGDKASKTDPKATKTPSGTTTVQTEVTLDTTTKKTKTTVTTTVVDGVPLLRINPSAGAFVMGTGITAPTESITSSKGEKRKNEFISIQRGSGSGAVLNEALTKGAHLCVDHAYFRDCKTTAEEGLGIIYLTVDADATADTLSCSDITFGKMDTTTTPATYSSFEFLASDPTTAELTETTTPKASDVSKAALVSAIVIEAEKHEYVTALGLETLEAIEDLDELNYKYLAIVGESAYPSFNPLLYYVLSPAQSQSAYAQTQDTPPITTANYLHIVPKDGVELSTCGWVDLGCGSLAAALTAAQSLDDESPLATLTPTINIQPTSQLTEETAAATITQSVLIQAQTTDVDATHPKAQITVTKNTNSEAFFTIGSASTEGVGVTFADLNIYMKADGNAKTGSGTIGGNLFALVLGAKNTQSELTLDTLTITTSDTEKSTPAVITSPLINAQSGRLVLKGCVISHLYVQASTPLILINSVLGGVEMCKNAKTPAAVNTFDSITRMDSGGVIFELEIGAGKLFDLTHSDSTTDATTGTTTQTISTAVEFTSCGTDKKDAVAAAIKVTLTPSATKTELRILNTAFKLPSGSQWATDSCGLWIVVSMEDLAELQLQRSIQELFKTGFTLSTQEKQHYLTLGSSNLLLSHVFNDPTSTDLYVNPDGFSKAVMPTCGWMDLPCASLTDLKSIPANAVLHLSSGAYQSAAHLKHTLAGATTFSGTEANTYSGETGTRVTADTASLFVVPTGTNYAITIEKMAITLTQQTTGYLLSNPGTGKSTLSVLTVTGTGSQSPLTQSLISCGGELAMTKVSISSVVLSSESLITSSSASSLISIASSSFSSITKSEGSGAILSVSNQKLAITDTSFRACAAPAGDGGALSISTTASVATVSIGPGVSFAGCQAKQYGGALFLQCGDVKAFFFDDVTYAETAGSTKASATNGTYVFYKATAANGNLKAEEDTLGVNIIKSVGTLTAATDISNGFVYLNSGTTATMASMYTDFTALTAAKSVVVETMTETACAETKCPTLETAVTLLNTFKSSNEVTLSINSNLTNPKSGSISVSVAVTHSEAGLVSITKDFAASLTIGTSDTARSIDVSFTEFTFSISATETEEDPANHLAHSIFALGASNTALTLVSCTFTSGSETAPANIHSSTTLIDASRGKLTLNGCTFSSLTLKDQPLIKVSALDDALVFDTSVTTFSSITRSEGAGPAVLNLDLSNDLVFTLTLVTFKNCKSLEKTNGNGGGAIYIKAKDFLNHLSFGASLTFTSCRSAKKYGHNILIDVDSQVKVKPTVAITNLPAVNITGRDYNILYDGEYESLLTITRINTALLIDSVYGDDTEALCGYNDVVPCQKFTTIFTKTLASTTATEISLSEGTYDIGTTLLNLDQTLTITGTSATEVVLNFGVVDDVQREKKKTEETETETGTGTGTGTDTGSGSGTGTDTGSGTGTGTGTGTDSGSGSGTGTGTDSGTGSGSGTDSGSGSGTGTGTGTGSALRASNAAATDASGESTKPEMETVTAEGALVVSGEKGVKLTLTGLTLAVTSITDKVMKHPAITVLDGTTLQLTEAALTLKEDEKAQPVTAPVLFVESGALSLATVAATKMQLSGTNPLISVKEGTLALDTVTFSEITLGSASLIVALPAGFSMDGANVFKTITRTSGSGSVFEFTLKDGESLAIRAAAFEACQSRGGHGGAIAVTLTGGAFTLGGDATHKVSFTKCTCRSSAARSRLSSNAGGNGGAVYVAVTKDAKSASVSLSQVDITSSTASGNGGGVYVDVAAEATGVSLSLTDTSIADSAAGESANGDAFALVMLSNAVSLSLSSITISSASERPASQSLVYVQTPDASLAGNATLWKQISVGEDSKLDDSSFIVATSDAEGKVTTKSVKDIIAASEKTDDGSGGGGGMWWIVFPIIGVVGGVVAVVVVYFVCIRKKAKTVQPKSFSVAENPVFSPAKAPTEGTFSA